MHGHGFHMHSHSEEESTVSFYDRALMSRLMKFLVPHKYKFILALVLMFTTATYMMVTPYLQKVAIDDYVMPTFSMASVFQRDLDDRIISQDFRQKFEERTGTSLSQSAAISDSFIP